MKIRGLITEYFLTKKDWRDTLGIILNRYQRGNELLNILQDPLMLLGIGSIMIGVTLDFIPTWTLPIIGVLWVWVCYTLGYLDEKYGFWKNQQKHLAGTINPVLKEVWEDVKEIKEWHKKEKLK